MREPHSYFFQKDGSSTSHLTSTTRIINTEQEKSPLKNKFYTDYINTEQLIDRFTDCLNKIDRSDTLEPDHLVRSKS